MRFSVLAVLSAPLLVSAQGYGGGVPAYSGPAVPSSSAATAPPLPSPGPNERIVVVGEGGNFTYNPTPLDAPKGTVIRFLFLQPQGFLHSISESSFDKPCSPLSGGFNSGLQGPGMEFNLTITDDTRPIWFYCQNTQPLKHCGMGMVGGINVPKNGSNTYDAFHAAAAFIGNSEGAQTATAVALTGVAAAATAPAASRVAAAPSASSGSSGSSSGPGSSGSGSVDPGSVGSGSSGPGSSGPSSSNTGSSGSSSSGAEKLVVSAGSLMATFFIFVGLA